MTEWVLRSARGRTRFGHLASLGLFLVAAAAAQEEVLSIPVSESGELQPPPGFRLERVGVIDTFAGTGEDGDAGDGGHASEAQLCLPAGVAVDRRGNVFVADTWNHRIRKINPSGFISTLAGTGDRGDGGDGGPASQARLAYPMAVTADAAGNVYVADSRESPHPEGHPRRPHLDRCWNRQPGQRGRRRPRYPSTARPTCRSCCGHERRPVYRRQPESPHPEGECLGPHLDRRRNWRPGRRRRWRAGFAGQDCLSRRRFVGLHRQCVCCGPCT